MNTIYTGYKIITITSTSQQAISLGIIGSLVSLLGFGVVFFQLSFENFRNTYGAYARSILYKSLGNELLYTFIGTTFSAMMAALFEKLDITIYSVNYFAIRDLFFNISAIFFFVFIIKLLKKLSYVLKYSLSYQGLTKIIEEITLERLREVKPNYSPEYNISYVLKAYESNSYEILSEIVVNSIIQNNQKIAEILVSSVTTHFKNIIESLN